MQPAPSDERTSMSVLQYLVFLKWLLYSCLIGIVVGGVAISFHYGIDWATQLRGAHPNVIFFLPLGGVVTTPRTFVQYVVTEYGVADLKYKSCRERSKALIAIAHPDFRKELEKDMPL